MKVVSTDALTKLIQLVKSAFIRVDDTVATSEVTLATVATTGDYDDLINTPTIPTVNNPTITIKQGGVTKGSFTLNQATGATIALDAGGGGGDYVETAGDTMTGSLTLYTNPGSGLTTNLTFLDKYNNGIDLFQDAETLKVHLHTANKTILFPTTSGTLALTSDIPVTDVTVGGTSVVSSGVAAVPAIPTVNNPTITIKQGGVTKGSFTLNQATGATIALDAGGGSPNWGGIGGTLSDQTDLQNALNAKQATITGGATTITSSNLTINRAVISNGSGKVAVSTTTSTELGYLHGVTSAIQTQLNDKVDKGHQVIAFQEPTAANNYTWYRKYADGWVEQGGVTQTNTNPRTVTFPVTMADTNYQVLSNVKNARDNVAVFTMQPRTLTTTSMTVYCTYSASHGSGGAGEFFYWQVSGMAA